MKVSAFHLMPHRELPHDFEQRYESVWVTPPWWELADARRVGQYYNWTLDELLHAARAGFDGICTNEHHQNAYGFMPSPNLMGSVLAKQTNDLDVAIVQMGMTLPTTSPPIRIAEEYAMLDCISGGRLVAGLPLGSPDGREPGLWDHADGAPRAVSGGRRAGDEGLAGEGDLRVERQVLPARDGEPVAPAHPAAAPAHLDPGIGEHQHVRLRRRPERLLLLPELFGRPVREGHDGRVLAGGGGARGSSTIRTARGSCSSWPSPRRMRRRKADYARHVEYFYHKCLHVPPQWGAPPGNQDYRSLLAANRSPVRRVEDPKTLRYKDFVDKGYVIAGSPATVRERLVEEVIKGLHVGNLMVLVQIGSMPHELTLKNIDLFAQEVLPHLRDIWDEEGWENHWWPERLRGARQPVAVGAGR